MSNESKLVPRNLDLGAHLKWVLLIVRAILDAGPRYKVQCNSAILLVESHRLDPWPLDEGPNTKKW